MVSVVHWAGYYMKNIFLFISSEAIKDFEDKVIDSTYAISPLKPLSHFLNLGTLVGFIYIFWFSLLSTSSLLKLCTASYFWLVSHVIYLNLTRVLNVCLLTFPNWVMGSRTLNYTKKTYLALDNLAELMLWSILSFKNLQHWEIYIFFRFASER